MTSWSRACWPCWPAHAARSLARRARPFVVLGVSVRVVARLAHLVAGCGRLGESTLPHPSPLALHLTSCPYPSPRFVLPTRAPEVILLTLFRRLPLGYWLGSRLIGEVRADLLRLRAQLRTRGASGRERRRGIGEADGARGGQRGEVEGGGRGGRKGRARAGREIERPAGKCRHAATRVLAHVVRSPTFPRSSSTHRRLRFSSRAFTRNVICCRCVFFLIW